MARTTPTLAQLLVSAMDSRLDNLHTAIPCKIESYDATEQTASVKPQIKNPIKTENGEVKYEEFPVLPNLPVAFPRGGGFNLQFPLAKGDYGVVIFSERAIDEWRESGDLTEPSNTAKHSLQGAIFLPMGYPDVSKLSDGDDTNMSLGKDGGATIKITPDDVVELYGNATGIGLGEQIDFSLSTIASKVNQLVAAVNAAHGAGLLPISTDYSSVISDKVKVGSN